MGANAVTTVPVYTAGEILTAADLNITNSGIPVFATTVTRDAAFGGSGEKVLAQGQTCYIEATSSYQTYTGSTWVTFGSGGLTLVTAETAFTGASSVSVNNCFSSTYTSYKLLFRVTTSSDQVALKLRVSGTDSSTGYYGVNYDMYSSNAAISSTVVQSNTAYCLVGNQSSFNEFNIFQPNVASQTFMTGTGARYESSTPRAESTGTNYKIVHSPATAYDGFTIYPLSGTMTGHYTIYGFTKA
jgi:hypothetical protein